MTDSSDRSKTGATGLVSNIQRYSIHDGPGIRTMVFLKGCPLACLWCSNPEGQNQAPELKLNPGLCIACGRCVEVCPTGAAAQADRGRAAEKCTACGACAEVCPSGARQMVGRRMTVEEVMAEVAKDAPFFRRSGGGVTLTGGEPLLQAAFAAQVLKRCAEKGFDTTLETCGAVGWSAFEPVLPYLNLVLFDLKLIDPDRHQKLTGRSNEQILENAARLAASPVEMVVRVPVIPGLNDSRKNLQDIIDFTRTLEGVGEIHLLPYHRLGEPKYNQLGKVYQLSTLKTLDQEELAARVRELDSGGLSLQVGG